MALGGLLEGGSDGSFWTPDVPCRCDQTPLSLPRDVGAGGGQNCLCVKAKE